MNYRLLLPACLAAALCFSQSARAQSGRRHPKASISSQPPVAAEPPAGSRPKKPAADITSIVVYGESSDTAYLYSRSNYIDIALKECVTRLKERPPQPPGLSISYGGRLNFEETVKLVKKEPDNHILWLELAMKDDGYGNSIVDHLDYTLMAPLTAKRLVTGRVEPGNTNIIGAGGGIRLPTARSRRQSPVLQIKSISREIVNRLIYSGWL